MNSSIKLIVGLGNPGPQYSETRHNAGVWLVDQILNQFHASLKSDKKFKADIAKINLAHHELLIAVPTTYMNLSGESVQAIAHFYKIAPNEILVAHDELDLPVGTVRLKKGGGHGGHNGLRSITACLNSNDFYRLRIGIAHPGSSHLVSDYVLSRPSHSDRDLIDQSIERAVAVLPDMIHNIPAAMQQLHTFS